LQLNRSEQAYASRARWLAELADEIESAQRLAWQLGTATRPSFVARELYGRLEAARLELESMRGGTSHEPLPRPARLDALGWTGSLLDPAD
jgi:acyl-CoA hydrolase